MTAIVISRPTVEISPAAVIDKGGQLTIHCLLGNTEEWETCRADKPNTEIYEERWENSFHCDAVCRI